MKSVGIVIMVALLQGCGMLQATVVDSGPRHVVIADAFGGTNKQQMAEQHCQKEGRHAVFRSNVTEPVHMCYDGTCYYYECVQ